MKKIGITGASGHIGNVLCETLLKQGHEVGVLTYQSKIDLAVSTHTGDITNLEDVRNFVKHYEVIIHAAADINVGGNQREKMWQTNVLGTKNIVEACLEYKIARLVHFSSIAAIEQFPLHETLDETRPLVSKQSKATAYGISKAYAEMEVREGLAKGLDAVIVVPTSVLGPNDFKPSVLGQSLLDMYHNKIPAVVKGGQDWVDVRDIVAGTLLALEKGKSGEKYLLGSEFYTIQELSQMIGDIYQRKTPSLALPFWVARLGVPFESIKSKLNGKVSGFTQEALTALQYGNTQISHEKASSELGYEPRKVKEALKETIDWLLVHHKN